MGLHFRNRTASYLTTPMSQKEPEMPPCDCNNKKNQTLIYACSGASNVGRIADLAARRLASEGAGKMSCLAALAAEEPENTQEARDASVNLVIIGCTMDCARKIFDRMGLTNTRFLQVTELEIEKRAGNVDVTEEQIHKTVIEARTLLNGKCAART